MSQAGQGQGTWNTDSSSACEMNWHRFVPALAQMWLQNKVEQEGGEGRGAYSWPAKTEGYLTEKGERAKGSEVRKLWLCLQHLSL